MRTLGLMTFMVPIGFATATGTLTGQAIGAAKPELVRHYYNLAVRLSVFIALLIDMVLIVFKELIINSYTKNPEIKAEIGKAWLIFTIFVIFDTTNAIGGSFIRASGQQATGAKITSAAYFVFGIPTTLLMVFWQDLGIVGIWVGPTIATLFNTISYLHLFQKMDLEKLV